MKAVSLLLLAAMFLPAALPAAVADERPMINVEFDDDASSLVISAQWRESGKNLKESFVLGKDMHLTFTKGEKEWEKVDGSFRSKSWEAFMYPDGTGFFLMEREYNGQYFENISLRFYQYYPRRREGNLRPANGTPWWSPDSKQLALVEDHRDGSFGLTIYDMDQGRVLLSRSKLSDATVKELTDGFAKARICDDMVPCETLPMKKKKKKR